MPAVQTTYSENIPIALSGMLADGDNSVDTYVVETAAGIGFGLAVSQGTADGQCLIGAAAATGFIGVTVRDKTVPNGVDTFAQYDNVGVCQRGEIWVTTGGTVAAGGDVTFASTTGVLSSAATSGTQFAIAGARWRTSASSGGLALLSLPGYLPSA